MRHNHSRQRKVIFENKDDFKGFTEEAKELEKDFFQLGKTHQVATMNLAKADNALTPASAQMAKDLLYLMKDNNALISEIHESMVQINELLVKHKIMKRTKEDNEKGITALIVSILKERRTVHNAAAGVLAKGIDVVEGAERYMTFYHGREKKVSRRTMPWKEAFEELLVEFGRVDSNAAARARVKILTRLNKTDDPDVLSWKEFGDKITEYEYENPLGSKIKPIKESFISDIQDAWGVVKEIGSLIAQLVKACYEFIRNSDKALKILSNLQAETL